MDLKLEQRANVKFCVKLGKSASETLTLLREAYGAEAMGRTQCFEWHKRFQKGRSSLEDEERSGRPSSSITEENVEVIRELIHEDRRRSIEDISRIVGVSYGSVQAVLTSELNMRRITAKFVPRLLTSEQKTTRLQICEDLRQRASEDDSLLSRIITGDESWVYAYDPETKQQSSQWKSPSSPRPQKARQSRSSLKTMLIIFFDIRGIVHREFLPEGQTVNKEFYCNILRRLRENVRRKRADLWRAGNWLLHDDNAPCHRALLVREFLARNTMATLPHPPYSPDLAPADFFLFPKMKLRLKGRRFGSIGEIQRESQSVLDTLTVEDFQTAFGEWQKRWDRCVSSQGNYFEGVGV